MKLARLLRNATVGMSIAALLLFAPVMPTQAKSRKAPDKRVDITVQLYGNISGYTIASVEKMVGELLDEAFDIVNADGADILELSIVIFVDDDDDDNDGIKDAQDDDDEGDGDGDGKGFHIDGDCGGFDFDEDIDALDDLADALHHLADAFEQEFDH